MDIAATVSGLVTDTSIFLHALSHLDLVNDGLSLRAAEVVSAGLLGRSGVGEGKFLHSIVIDSVDPQRGLYIFPSSTLMRLFYVL